MKRARAPIILGVMSLAGCPGDIKIGGEDVFPPKYMPVCPIVACDINVHFDFSEMASCFGWDPETGWPPSAPSELDISWCRPDLNLDCDLITGPISVGTVPDDSCHCRSLEFLEDPESDCCNEPEFNLEGIEWQSYVTIEFLEIYHTCITTLGQQTLHCEILEEDIDYFECN